MAQYTYQAIVGGDYFTATPTSSDTVAPDDRGFLVYSNTNASTRTITIPAPASFDFATSTLPDFTWTLAANPGKLIIPCYPQFADPSTGLITVNISATTNVTVAALRR